MAVGTIKIYTRAKRYMQNGTITLGAGVFKMMLLRASASAAILKISNGGISTWASLSTFEITAQGGYAANGRNIVPATGKLTVGSSVKQMKFTQSTIGVVFTANGAALNNIKYLAIRNSTGAGAGKLVGYCTLSTAAFTIANGNTLTITANASGFFVWA